MRSKLRLKIGLLLMLFMLAAYPGMASDSPVGYMQTAEGTVEIMHKDGKVEAGAYDLAILPEDVITTGASSKAQIMFLDKTVLALSEDSKVSIFDVYTPQKGGLFEMEFLSGTARLITSKTLSGSPEKFRAMTPLGSIGIRGTELGLIADPGHEVVMLYEGGPAVYTDGQIAGEIEDQKKAELCKQIAESRKKIEKAYDTFKHGMNFRAKRKAKQQLDEVIAYQAQYHCAPQVD